MCLTHVALGSCSNLTSGRDRRQTVLQPCTSYY